MRFYVIAGEASGDLHGANLIKALKTKSPESEFRAWGGDLMEAQGATIVKHYRDLAFMGFTEVLLNLRTIFRNIAFCKQDLLAHRPDALILIDYPGFNMRIAEFAKQNGIKVFYYISPQIWAWKESRVHKLKKTVDHMMVILPFEKDFYAKHGMEVTFVGHPLLDVINGEETAAPIERKSDLIALLPGSRRQEIKRMLPIMLRMPALFPDHKFVIAGAPSIEPEFYHQIISEADVQLVFGQTHELFKTAKAGLVTSGTATLEAALFGMPQVVCYKGGRISYLIARMLIKVKYISLVNLIADKEIVKELIQKDLSPTQLKHELSIILSPEGSVKMQADYLELRQLLGGPGASERTAGHVLKNCP